MPPIAVEIVECHRDFVVVFKEAGIHSAPLQPNDTNCALLKVAEQFPEVLSVKGKKEVEGGLVHRIDQDTSGLLLIARNQGFYNHIISCQDAGLFQKGYTARCHYLPHCGELLGGFPPPPLDTQTSFPADFTLESGFRPYGSGRKQVRPVTQHSGKFSRKKAGKERKPSKAGEGDLCLQTYSTSFQLVQVDGVQGGFRHELTIDASDTLESAITVRATITKGYRHQVRCHLAWCGLPIIADPLYNPTTEEGQAPSPSKMQFFATSLSFPLIDCPEAALQGANQEVARSSKLFSVDISQQVLSSL